MNTTKVLVYSTNSLVVATNFVFRLDFLDSTKKKFKNNQNFVELTNIDFFDIFLL